MTVKADALNNIINEHREIFVSILANPLLPEIIKGKYKSVKKFSKRIIATMLINHCQNAYSLYEKNIINHDEFYGMQKDIINLFSWPIIKKRWPKIKSYYPDKFQNLINSLIYNQSMDSDQSSERLV